MAKPLQGEGKASEGTTAQKTSMTLMSIEALPVGLSVPFDVFRKDGSTYQILLKKWTKFDPNFKSTWKSNGIFFVYVEGDPAKVYEYFEKKPEEDPAAKIAAHASYVKDKNAYHNVSRLVFKVGSTVDFSLFRVDNLRFVPILQVLQGKTAEITEAVKASEGEWAIKETDIPLYRAYLSASMKKVAADNASLQIKVAGVKETTKISIRDVLADPTNSKNIEGVVFSANSVIGMLKHKDAVLGNLLSKNAKDFHIYNHSSNVAVLSASMGIALRMSDKQVENLSIGAMMHDIGKGSIPIELLNKRERLTDQEFEVWKKHVPDGVKIAQSHSGLPRECFSAIEQHHERMSGNGYPSRLSGSMMTNFGKIISIIDCFDLLVTPKPFKIALTPFMALDLIMRETNEKKYFDLELVKLFVKILRSQGKV